MFVGESLSMLEAQATLNSIELQMSLTYMRMQKGQQQREFLDDKRDLKENKRTPRILKFHLNFCIFSLYPTRLIN